MLETQVQTLRKYFERPIVPGDNGILQRIHEELKLYFAGELKKFTVPLASPGSPCQREVWNGHLSIPYGSTLSYEGLARKLHAPGVQRAVGHTNGLNRLAIVILCRRVVNENGDLGGYGGGLWRKKELLELERGERSFAFAMQPAPYR